MGPNFFIVGAAKSGTSSLDKYLGQHPQVFMAPRKESHFFVASDLPADYQLAIRDERAYLRMFDDVKNETAVGESSVFYLYYESAPYRISRAAPAAKIIIILRNPVDRAYSAYTHLVRDGREHLTFEESLRLEADRKKKHVEPIWYYRELGLYHGQVARYLDVFGSERVKVVLTEDLLQNPQQVLNTLFDFLGVEPDVMVDTSKKHNVSGVPKSRLVQNVAFGNNLLKQFIKSVLPDRLQNMISRSITAANFSKEAISPETRRELTAYFADDINKLESLLNMDLSKWRKGL